MTFWNSSKDPARRPGAAAINNVSDFLAI